MVMMISKCIFILNIATKYHVDTFLEGDICTLKIPVVKILCVRDGVKNIQKGGYRPYSVTGVGGGWVRITVFQGQGEMTNS